MTCNSCAQLISKHLEKKGLDVVHVDYPNGEVEIEDAKPLDENYLIEEINSLGYHAYEKNSGANQLQKSLLSSVEWQFLICAIFTVPLLLHMLLPFPILHEPWFQFSLCVPVIAIGIRHFGFGAWGSVRAGMPNMDVLILLGSTTAFIYSTVGWILFHGSHMVHNYLFFETAATIITLVLMGNIIENRSLKKTTKALTALTKIQPQNANLIVQAMTANEQIEKTEAGKLHVHDLVLVNTGEQIPADGLIYWGAGTIDESAMTGESAPAEKHENDTVLAGTIVISGSIKFMVQQCGSNTILSSMIEMVKKAATRKPEIQKVGDKVSAVFVPVVILLSILTFVLSYFIADKTVQSALMSSIAVLVISCPCAMGLATPTAVAVGVGRAAANGILIKGGDILERINKIDCVVFDKTGTLTEGKLSIGAIHYYRDEELVKFLLGNLEKHSSHPIAQALAAAFGAKKNPSNIQFKEIKEEKGFGVIAIDKSGNRYSIGSAAMVKNQVHDPNHQVYVLMNGEVLAWMDFNDDPRVGAKETISYFNNLGIRTIILSGDTASKCEELAAALGIKEVHSGQLPTQKVEFIRNLQRSNKVAMLGDGINDAAALAESWVGIAMGSGTQIAMQSADVLLVKPHDLQILVKAHELAGASIRTIHQNLFWALIYNVIAIPIAGAGLLSPMIASFSMAFSDVVVIGNSLRLRIKKIPFTK